MVIENELENRSSFSCQTETIGGGASEWGNACTDRQTFYRQTAMAIANYLRQELNILPGVHHRIAEATSGPRVLALTLMVNPRYARQIASLSEQLAWRRD
jgi:hypothetical protein